ncbi:gliding motility-associated C-terminal domain-containing protein, partial [Lentimicrobium sp. S6]|uniref:gliding motility-associated C-terminal domain-containing protein n=1 Tax=Lentimicrobium sp. S6 TaxID=2735872 RepID=UPI001553E232
ILHTYIPFEEQLNELFTVSLTATSDSACVATDSIVEMISLYSMPIPSFEVYPDSVAITEKQDIILTNTSENAVYYEWLMSDTILWEDVYEPHVYEEIQDTGRFNLKLYAQSSEGCLDSTDSYFVVYPVLRFFVPNAFSPNGNGINEYFGPQGRYFEDKSYNFRIFNRWGKQVYETNDYYQPWDGVDESTGEIAPIGVYAYVIELTDLNGKLETYRGVVTLIL